MGFREKLLRAGERANAALDTFWPGTRTVFVTSVLEIHPFGGESKPFYRKRFSRDRR